MKKILATLSVLLFSFSVHAADYPVEKIHVLKINSSINPAQHNYLETHLKKMSPEKHDMVLITMNTPGGLVTTTKDIITMIGSLKVPVAIWITPEGASATSAGAIIASSAHFLFMANGANIGAATPVGIGKDIEKSDGKEKAINDLVALVSSLSKARGRNEKLFGEMISKAASYDAQTAKKEKIIDSIINNRSELIDYINNKHIKVLGEDIKITTSGQTQFVEVEMDLGQSLLNIFSHPTTAYILFVIGAALMYLEFQAPGGFIAGSIGVICLVMAAIGFQVLPLNYGAMGLIILSFFLFILEAYITSYGILTLGGVASLVFGSLFLFRSEDGYMALELSLILSVVATVVLYVLFVGLVLFKTWGNKKQFFALQGETAHIMNSLPNENNLFYYQVKVAGEIWKAFSKEELSLNDKVKIIAQDTEHMMVEIKKDL